MASQPVEHQVSASRPASAAPAEEVFVLPEATRDIWTADQLELEDAEKGTSIYTFKIASEHNSALAPIHADFAKYVAKGLFKNDYLAYCKILGIRPHPQLLPVLPPVEPPKDALPSTRLQSRHSERWTELNQPPEIPPMPELVPEHFDFTPLDHVTIRHMLFGRADQLAVVTALRPCTHIRSLVFSRAGLDTDRIIELATALPHTSVTELTLEYNPLPDNGQEAHKKQRVFIPKGCAPLPFPIYSGEFEPSEASSNGSNNANSSPSQSPRPDEDSGKRSRSSSPRRAGRSSSREPSRGGNRRGSVTALTTYGLPGKTKARAFALLTKRFQKLKRLSLRGNGIGPSEAYAIGMSLVHNIHLQSLILSHNPIGGHGFNGLMTGLREHRGALAMLGLANTGVPESALPMLVESLSGLAVDVDGMRSRAELEQRLVAELVADINGLGLRDVALAELKAVLDAELAEETAKLAAAAAAAAPPPDPKAKPAKGAPAPAPAPVAAPTIKREHHPSHPDADFFHFFRLPAAKETSAVPEAREASESDGSAVGSKAGSKAGTPTKAAPPAPAAAGKPPAGKAPVSPAQPEAVPPPISVPVETAAVAPAARTFAVAGNRTLVQIDLSGNTEIGPDGLTQLAESLAALLPPIPPPVSAEETAAAQAAAAAAAVAAAQAPAAAPEATAGRRASLAASAAGRPTSAGTAVTAASAVAAPAPPPDVPKLKQIGAVACAVDVLQPFIGAANRPQSPSPTGRRASITGRRNSLGRRPSVSGQNTAPASIEPVKAAKPANVIRVTDHAAVAVRQQQAARLQEAKAKLATVGVNLLL